jgi:hypothetical protein
MFSAVVTLKQVKASGSFAPEDHIPVVLTLAQFEQLRRFAQRNAAEQRQAVQRQGELDALLDAITQGVERA